MLTESMIDMGMILGGCAGIAVLVTVVLFLFSGGRLVIRIAGSDRSAEERETAAAKLGNLSWYCFLSLVVSGIILLVAVELLATFMPGIMPRQQ